MQRNRCLTMEEEAKLRRTMARRGDLLGRRDYAWLRLLLTTGMRLKEFSLLTLGDARAALKTGYLFIPREHRKKQACDLSVHARGEARDALTELMTVCARMLDVPLERLPDHHPLVMTRRGAAMSCRGYQLRMKEMAVEAGVDPAISPHWMRHTFAMTFLEHSEATAGGAMVRLKNLLGHSSNQSCMAYLKMSRGDVGEEIERIFPSKRRVRTRILRRAYEERARVPA